MTMWDLLYFCAFKKIEKKEITYYVNSGYYLKTIYA